METAESSSPHRRLASTAENAVYSAGAIGWLQKPVSGAMFDDMWDDILGPVPVAPGLADLDALHPGADLPKIEILPDPEALPPPHSPVPAPTPAITPATMQVTAPTPNPYRDAGHDGHFSSSSSSVRERVWPTNLGCYQPESHLEPGH